jgi:hypothetical protein
VTIAKLPELVRGPHQSHRHLPFRIDAVSLPKQGYLTVFSRSQFLNSPRRRAAIPKLTNH